MKIYFFTSIIILSLTLTGCSNLGEQITIEITPELTEAVQKYDELGEFHEGLAKVEKDGKFGYIDSKGNEVIPCRYDGVGDFSEGLALAQIANKWGYVDKKGNSTFTGR